MTNLRQATFNGVIWSSVQRFGTMFITFASNIILARRLTPNDYGCIAMLMIFISLANTFIDGGFGSALIQKKQPTNKDYSTIFYWNIFLSLLLYGILYFCAPFIAEFYRTPLLTKVLRVQGAVLFFNALSIIQQNLLRKNLQFKKLSFVYITSASISLIAAIITAYKGWGVWSLVTQLVSISVLNSLLFWIISKWRPIRAFSWQSFKELFSFGGYMLLSQLFGTLSNEIQGLLVGRIFNAATLGLYNQAYRLEGSAATATSSIIDQVTYPVLSSVQDRKDEFISALKRFIQIPAYICSFIMMILIIVAKPLIILLYSDKWIECVPYFQILCCAGLAVCLQGSANNSIAAIGKSNVFFVWTIIKRSLTIILCIVGVFWAGMPGLLWGCVTGAWTVYFINAYLVHKYVGYSFINQLWDIMPSLILSIFIGVFVYVMGKNIHYNMYLIAIFQIIIATGFYFLSSWMLKLDAFKYLLNIILPKIYKSNKA